LKETWKKVKDLVKILWLKRAKFKAYKKSVESGIFFDSITIYRHGADRTGKIEDTTIESPYEFLKNRLRLIKLIIKGAGHDNQKLVRYQKLLEELEVIISAIEEIK